MNLILSLLIFLNTPFYRAPVKDVSTKINGDIVWVYFTDKGFTTESEYQRIIENFTPNLSNEAIERRLNYSGKVFDYDDLPVCQKYIDEIVNLGGELRTVSNWLNAASFRIPPPLLERVYYMPFVYNISPVAVHTQEFADGLDITQTDKGSKKPDTASQRHFYGLAYEQNAMLGIPSVFNRGYTGSRVKLGLLDTGLKRKHNALMHLKVFKEHDFLGGDNFWFRYLADANVSIPNLRNIGLTGEPQFFKTTANRLFIFYAADTFINNQPYRSVFYSYNNNPDTNWSHPRCIRTTETYNMSIPVISVSGEDSVIYIAWQDLLPQAPNAPITNMFLRYIVQTTPGSTTTLLGQGKNPNIFKKGTHIYLTYTNPDSILYFRKGIIDNNIPFFSNAVIVNTLNEPLTNLNVIEDSLREIEIFALGRHSQTIYHFNSTDSGTTFHPLNAVENAASAIKTLISGNTIYILYKDYSNTPNVKLSFSKSTDGGNTWSQKTSVTNDLLTIGDFSFTVKSKDTIYVSYEQQGNLYLVKSNNFGNTWFEPTPIAQDFVYSPKINLLNGQPITVWFQRGDTNTDYDSTQDYLEQPNHGTRMASLIAGYQPYEMIGTAPGVDLLICKTELLQAINTNNRYETTTEEDIWIQGLEWAEREGASVISSSLGYRSWYTYKDFDGKTIPISIAAGLAAKRGVVVVSAMGNRDTTQFPWPNPYIVAPGDAIGIITAGGVTKSLTAWRGTGIGPTYDGRIKPDLSALADTAIVVAPDSASSYEGSIGTSCATALIAGCCAVLLEAHPTWNADSVKEALFKTASLSVPNCTLGWGIPNIDSVLKLYPPTRPEYEKDQLGYPYPNPFLSQNQPKIYFPILLMKRPATAEIRIYTLSGELVDTLTLNTQYLPAPGRYGVEGNKVELENIGAVWNGENASGKKVSSGIYFAVLVTSFGQDLKKFAVVR